MCEESPVTDSVTELVGPVIVEWVDSSQPVSKWQFVDDIEPDDGIVCRSAGWIVHDTAEVLMIAANVASCGQANGVITIPKCAVRSVRELTSDVSLTDQDVEVIHRSSQVLPVLNRLVRTMNEHGRICVSDDVEAMYQARDLALLLMRLSQRLPGGPPVPDSDTEEE